MEDELRPSLKKSASGLVLALALGIAASAAAQEKLTVVSWGGAYQESQRKAFMEPYAKDTGTQITEEEYNGEVAKIRAMVETNSVTWGVMDVDTPTAIQGCAEGILETIDWGKLGLDRSKFVGADLMECAVPNIVYATVIAYDADKTPNGPQTIADVFDLVKFPGKRGLQKNPFINLEWALIADGVDAADVYTVLETDEGVERAFKKLDTIKSEGLVGSRRAASMPADGQVVTRLNGRIYNAVVQDRRTSRSWDRQTGLGLVRERRSSRKPTSSSPIRASRTRWRSRRSTSPTVPPTRTPSRWSRRKPCRTCRPRPTT
jgi:putative spermidine/putrescine transport system substrate-binding protein